MQRTYWVYMMASQPNGTLYIGVTNDLGHRVHEHKTGSGSEFVARYDVTHLIWYETYSDINEAIAREKMLKKWRRSWKIDLIRAFNPDWRDLYGELNH